MNTKNLFDTALEESLFGGDPRDLFERLGSAVSAFEREYQTRGEPWPSKSVPNVKRAVYASARLLRLLCGRVKDADDKPLSTSLAVESALYTVIYTIIGRHLDPEEVFRD